MAERVRQGVTRYAGSQLHQTTVLEDVHVRVRAVVGQAVGEASGNSLEPSDLSALVEQATLVARRQAPDPGFVSLPGPEAIHTVDSYDSATAEMGAEGRVPALQTILDMARAQGCTVSGTYLTEGRELAVANSLGVATFAPSSMAYLRALPDSGEGTGYAAAWSHRAADLDPAAVATQALERCALNHNQQDVPPGEYEAIFGDLAVAEFLVFLARHGFSGQSFEEGTSFVSGRLGEQMLNSQVSIWDDAADPRGLAVAADYEGVPKRHLALIGAGVARGVAYDSYTAHKAGKHSTGHAMHPDVAYYGPMPSNLFMAGGEASVEDMIRATKHGLLVTRFHYTHCPDPKRVVMTGTTRDGTFLIKDGEIVSAVKNLRLTQSIPELFDGIELIGPPRLCQDWWCSNGMGRISYVCPPIKVSRATFSSGTLF
jgi:predicted Zn-dependent protease